MLVLGGRARAWEEGAERLQRLVQTGKAAQKFKELIQAQGGNPRVVDDPSRYLPRATHVRLVRSSVSGFVARLDALGVARAAHLLGRTRGRGKMDDRVNLGAGVLLEAKPGSRVVRGGVLARLYGSSESSLKQAERVFLQSLSMGKHPPRLHRLIRKVLR